MAHRYFEDYPIGAVTDCGTVRVSADEIMAFATRYDPQPFHVDPEAAKRWPYGGLIASGWHTASMAMRAVVDHFVDGETSLGSPGLGPIRWKLPVRPDDELAISLRVVDARRSISKPDRGTIVLELEMRNQRDEVVMLIENWAAIIRARTTGDPT
jgi:acyl dehydratase